MLLDVLAWALIIGVASAVGAGVLGILGADQLRSGDRLLIGTWIGVVLLGLTLLGVSVFTPLSPLAGSAAAGALGAAGLAVAVWSRRARKRRSSPDVPLPPWASLGGAVLLAVGAAALASDPVTLYDSLVYHVGIMRWLREHGTVPGLALIHNRLGHVSAWFTLAAPFDTGMATNRTANLPLGVALVLIGAQGALGAARIAARRATGADWFLAMSSAALLWAVLRYNAASPSPDVAANALIVVTAWSMLVVPRAAPPMRATPWLRWFTPRLTPIVLAIGASSMKLFALPAAIAAAAFYMLGSGDDRGARQAAVRGAVCAALGAVLLAPLIAANLVASGCPIFPSPLGCVAAPWSVGPNEAADYAAYIRDVARWESRQSAAGAARLPWVGAWIAAHPIVTTLAVLAPILAAVLLSGPRRDGVRSALLVAVLGTVFVAWQAPAPRFLYAFVIIAPIVALAYPLASASPRGAAGEAGYARVTDVASAAGIGFVTFAFAASAIYAIASQKVNILSALLSGAAPMPEHRAELLLPAAPETPARVYRWRVNDIEVYTAVPRPIADTLGYHSAIDGDVGFEKCSTAPLPCTPYLPKPDVRLRAPSRGLAGGFARAASGTALTARMPRCVGELAAPFKPSLLAQPAPAAGAEASGGCREASSR
jgi:hypothetical protein